MLRRRATSVSTTLGRAAARRLRMCGKWRGCSENCAPIRESGKKAEPNRCRLSSTTNTISRKSKASVIEAGLVFGQHIPIRLLIAVRCSILACHVIADSSAAFGFGMTRLESCSASKRKQARYRNGPVVFVSEKPVSRRIRPPRPDLPQLRAAHSPGARSRTIAAVHWSGARRLRPGHWCRRRRWSERALPACGNGQ
jgi:hypothetical protein